MKKIGIVTLYDDINLGNKLQNYAVQRYFELKGFECETINYEKQEYNFLHKFAKRLIKFIGLPPKKAYKFRIMDERKNKFSKFSQKYINVTEMVNFKNLPSNLNEKYDYFVTGSDQVWHNWSDTKEELEFFFLSFCDRNKRLTMAPSFGKDEVEPRYAKLYKELLLGFDSITVREESGAHLIKKLTNHNAEVILDPTMLIDRNEWEKIAVIPSWYSDKEYILVYSLGNMNESLTDFVKNTARDNNLDIIDVFNMAHKEHYLTAPDEFLYLIKNANLIVTDSFHACVFSVLFKKNFIVFNRTQKNMETMGNRIDTLLNKFGLSMRKWENIDRNSIFDCKFDLVDSVLESERKKAEKLYSMI